MIIQNFHSKVIDNACPYLPIHISWPFWLCYTLLWMCCQFFVIYVILPILWETFVWLVNLDENIVLQNSIQIVRKNTPELVQNSSYSVLKVLAEKTRVTKYFKVGEVSKYRLIILLINTLSKFDRLFYTCCHVEFWF